MSFLEEDTKTLDLVDDARVRQECYLINRGCRDCASLICRESQIEELFETINGEGLLVHITDSGASHKELTIFKQPHIKRILEELEKLYKSSPYLRHWCLGKLFGYSEEAIAKFLNRSSKNKNW